MQLTHVHALYYYLGHTYQYDGRIMNRSCLWQWSVIITCILLRTALRVLCMYRECPRVGRPLNMILPVDLSMRAECMHEK